MPERSRSPRAPRPALAASGLAAVLIVLAVLVWFRPYLSEKRGPTAGVPTPSPLFVAADFPVAPHQQACMQDVTIESSSRVAEFELRPASVSKAGGPPVDLVLSGDGYSAVVHVPGGYPGGGVTLPMSPPAHTLIGSACFVNRGHSTVLLAGSTEPRTVARSPTLVAGKAVVGDVSLTFLGGAPRSLQDELGEVFGHVSTLTDDLVPVWLIWILALLVAFGMPIAVIAAIYFALSEEEDAVTG